MAIKLEKREKRLINILKVILVMAVGFLFIIFSSSDSEDDIDLSIKKNTEKQEEKTPTTTTEVNVFSGGGGGGSSSGGGGMVDAPSYRGVTLSEYENHNTVDDCWVILDGQVFDITEYLTEYFSSEEVGPYCGTFAFQTGFLQDSKAHVKNIKENAGLIGNIF